MAQNPSTAAILVEKINQRERRRHDKRLHIVLLVWAIAASASFAWYGVQTTTEQQARVWNSDAVTLESIGSSFFGSNVSLLNLLRSGDYVWGIYAFSGVQTTMNAVQGGPAYPDGFPSAGDLGLSYDTVDRIRTNLWTTIPSGPNQTAYLNTTFPLGQYLVRVACLFGDIGTRLIQVRPEGTDPLAQIGPSGITAVKRDFQDLTVPMGLESNMVTTCAWATMPIG